MELKLLRKYPARAGIINSFGVEEKIFEPLSTLSNLMGKLGKAGDWLLALGTGKRTIAPAMVAATMKFGNDEVVMVVVYSLIAMVGIIPLALELGKRAAKKV